MNMKNNKGFSLVELIVVIAIMAILAAVAVIGVSVYIPKAQEAADKELCNVLGDALRTACLSEGVDPSTITATIAVDAEGKLAAKADGTVNLVISGTSKQDKLLELFNQIFTEKNAVTKKPMGNQLKFDGKTFAWNNGTNNPTLNYGGGTIVLDQKDIDALKGSTYYGMGMGPLMNQLDMVSDLTTHLVGGNALGTIVGSEDFKKNAAKSLGIDVENNPNWHTVYEETVTQMTKDYLASQNPPILNPTTEQYTAALKKITANATVLYTANQATKMDRNEIDQFLLNPTQGEIIGNMTGANSDKGLAQAALMCGLYTSYVNSEYGEHLPAEKKVVNVENVLDAIENDETFKHYLTTEQGKADVNGFLGSMNMINSSTESSGAVKELMVQGFGDDELIKQLNQSIGK